MERQLIFDKKGIPNYRKVNYFGVAGGVRIGGEKDGTRRREVRYFSKDLKLHSEGQIVALVDDLKRVINRVFCELALLYVIRKHDGPYF